ncbi:type II toxin-antitoxin system mRNA interferase RelE [Streptosporangium fragile]|uniref:Type II toxin-antitoxin system mRNA interferase RelE n=1 Tax=Streptosporangium fragile TaxID=46186 RepID=A0ABN3VXS5_9ACTN
MSQQNRQPFEPVLGTAAKRAISDKLPLDVAAGAVDFITGPLLENPHRIGKELNEPLEGIYSARLMRDWRIPYEIHDQREPREVHILDIRHRADAYHRR